MYTATLASTRITRATNATPSQPTLLTALLALFKRVPTPTAPAACAVQELDAGTIVRVAQPMGRTISCQTGSLWLTFDNQPQDVVIEAGQSHRCTNGSALLIQSLVNARVLVE